MEEHLPVWWEMFLMEEHLPVWLEMVLMEGHLPVCYFLSPGREEISAGPHGSPDDGRSHGNGPAALTQLVPTHAPATVSPKGPYLLWVAAAVEPQGKDLSEKRDGHRGAQGLPISSLSCLVSWGSSVGVFLNPPP
ncbi:unnamed protein product [Gadus morhua 'NCC']